MPLADYRCPGCPGVVVRDHYFPMAAGASASAPLCPVCACYMDWIPQVGAIDAKEPFQRFEVLRQVPTRDGLVQQRETIDSVHKLRQIEKDSEQRYANGEGEPLRFRVYNQNASNMDSNSFGESGTIGGRSYDSGQAPQKKQNLGVRRHGTKKPKIPAGPGVPRSGSSPLKA